MKNLQNSVLTITMAIGLAITGLTPAHASVPSTIASPEADVTVAGDSITAAIVPVAYERPSVSIESASVVDAAVEVVQPPKSESMSTVATTPAKVPVPATPAVPATTAPAPVAPAAPGLQLQPVQFSGGAVVAAALAQLGVAQDCTALVTKSIAAVGINFHGWPAGYLSLGHTVPAAAAQPGDLAYYANGGMGVAHIAVYIGGGKAVHGGWNGGTTAIAPVNVGSGPVFIRL